MQFNKQIYRKFNSYTANPTNGFSVLVIIL